MKIWRSRANEYPWHVTLSHHIGHALDFAKEIDDFVGCHQDLHALELDVADWSAICLVAGWLKVFDSATTDMSKTKEPMLSTIHAIFRGLQDHVHQVLADLPDSALHQLRNGLIEAHKKLSDYHYHSDESLYYTWASCTLYAFPYFVFHWQLTFIFSTWSLDYVWRAQKRLHFGPRPSHWSEQCTASNQDIQQQELCERLIKPPFNHPNQVHPFLQPVVVSPAHPKR